MKVTLGRFGLDHCDLATMIDNVAVLLRLVTINIDQNYTKRIPLMNYLIVIIGALSYSYVYMISMVWFVFIRSRETGDFASAAVVFSLGIGSMTCAIKILFMIVYKLGFNSFITVVALVCIISYSVTTEAEFLDNLQDLVQQYLKYDATVTPGTTLHFRLNKQLRIIKKKVMTVWSSLIIILISYVLLPIVRPGRHLTEDLYVLYGLEPMFVSPNYEMAAIIMSTALLVGVYALACIIAFILIIIGYIEAHMRALSEEIESLWDDAELNYEKIKGNENGQEVSEDDIKIKYINDYINYRLKNIVTCHIANIIFLNTFEDIFRITMAVEFIFIIIAMVAELLGGIENTYIEIPYSFLQIYVNCNIGQKLLDASNQFEFSVYESKWENFDKANMKMILLILQSAQKPLALTAGGLTQLDYICLMSVTKSIYTFYTTLQSTVNT